MPQKEIKHGERSIPDKFIPISDSEDHAQAEHMFIPAASTKDDEYNVTIFHSFDASTVKSLLFRANDRMEFPFKEWRKENEIVRLKTEEPILLLGRSGTGKTTCCLYRLWNEFNGFWNPELNTTNLKITRKCFHSPLILSGTPDYEDVDQMQCVTQLATDDSEPANESDLLTESTGCLSSGFPLTQDQSKNMLLCSPDMNHSLPTSSDQTAVSDEENVEEISASCLLNEGRIKENLHQIFLTKNRVLCDYMKTSFYNMAAAHDFLKSHMKYETEMLPNSLSRICDEAFPLFLTARQFFILLDNSLGDTSTYFPRDKEGNMCIKIMSTDYDDDYRKMVMKLQESYAASSSTKQWIEVTALYFKDQIWRKIFPQHIRKGKGKGKEFEPLLVWTEIQSFIKGSETALRKGRPLSLKEYKTLGDRMAPSYAAHRDAIYDIFMKYRDYQQGQRHNVWLYDECDLILNIYNRIKCLKDIPWSIHSLYVDEVQDFTQAELAILVHCTRDVNSIFFTGDTAQTIARGISFRFEDIKSLFHHIAESNPKVSVPKLHNLTLNFRSHSGILGLAGSITDVIKEFFNQSIDFLPNDVSMLSGPIPVIVESCEVGDLALLLRANKREVSTIEFGSHQVILVQSQQARDNLPRILKGALVFTIFEAKGLEFDDVLLYNFFSDSMVDERGWRVVSSYLEMSKHQTKIINDANIGEIRSCQFDPNLNKSLNDELKRLYTAITRAKSNLWIYDSNENLRLPMFNYWYKRNLIKIVETHGNDGAYSVVFAANSTPEQWKAQGDNLMEKHHFEQALHCYQRAGKENKHLVKKADAYCMLQYALSLREHSKENPKLWLELAIKFLETAECCIRNNSLDCSTSVELLNDAAMCLRTSQLPRFSQVAQLFERVGKVEEASQMYLKAEDFDNYARMKEKLGQHNEVIQTLWNDPFFKKRDALAKAKSYEELNVQLLSKWTVSTLSYSCVKFYSERQDTQTLIEVLQYIPQVGKRVKFLKDAKLYTEAYDILVQHKYFKEACTLASAQGGCTDVTLITYANSKTWLSKGLKIATQISDEALRASFIFQMAGLDLKFGKKASEDLIKELKSLQSSKSYHVKAQAHLFFGMLKRSASNLNSAKSLYHDIKHSIGELEAFNQLQQFKNRFLTDQLLLNACHLSVETSSALKDVTVVCKELKDAISFYGMDWTGSCYLMPPGQNIWIKDLLVNCVCTDKHVDLDGMVRLEFAMVKNELVKHCKMFKFTWLACHGLQRTLKEKCASFTLHEQLWKDNLLNCTCPNSKACIEKLQEYLHTSVHMLELQCLNSHSDNQINIKQNIAMLVAVFTPRVSIFVQKPHQFNSEHISILRQSVNSQKWFQQYISESILRVQHDDIFQLEPWIMAWRACCISDPDMKGLFDILHKLENDTSSHATNIKSQHSPKFIFWHDNQQYYHIFSIWLNSCVQIREKEKPLWAARLAIKHFLGHIDAQHNIVSTLDIVYLLSVHCTSLLAILTHVNVLYGHTTNNYTVPLFYEKIVSLFDLMNTWKPEHYCLLPACGSDVRTRKNHIKVVDDCYHLLAESLQILLGSEGSEGYLELSLKNSPSEIGTHHCLILALVLLGNIINIYPVHNRHKQIRNYTDNLKSLIRGCLDNKTEISVPTFILKAKSAIGTLDISKAPNIFILVTKLLVDAQIDSTLAVMVIHQESGCVNIEPITDHSDTRQAEFTNSHRGTPNQHKREASSSLPQVIPSQMSQLQLSRMHRPTWKIPAPAHLVFAQGRGNEHVPHHFQPNVPLQPPRIVPPRARPPMWPQMFPQGATFNPTQSYCRSGDSQYPILEPHQCNQTPPSNRKYTESDDVEEEEIKLTAGLRFEPSIDPAVIDRDRIIVTDRYCNACGVNLINTGLPGISSTPAGSQSQDYYVHIMSPAHRESFHQFTIFLSTKDDKHYRKVVQDLNTVKEVCQKAKQAYDTHQLDQIIDGIQEEIDESVKTVSFHEKNRSWRAGSNAIFRLKESLSRLLDDYMESYSKVSDELKTKHEDEQINKDILSQDLQALERRTEKHYSMLDELDIVDQ